MRRFSIWLLVLSSGTTIGCSDNFMSLENRFAVFDFNMPADLELGTMQAFVCAPDKSVCGRRRGDDDHDPDTLVVTYEGLTVDALFEATGSGTDEIEAGAFIGEAMMVGPEDFETFHFNDLPDVTMVIPPRFQLSAPPADAELSRSSLNSLRIEWSNSTPGFPIDWKIFPVDNELELLPCDMLNWESIRGLVIDTGFVDIPMTMFPSDIPPEGCPMALRVARIQSFGLPEGIERGEFRSRVTDGVFFRLMP